MKTDFEKTKLVLSEARDSISIMNKLILSQDSLLVIKDAKIEIYKQNESNYTQVIKVKDDMIGVYEKKIKKRKKIEKYWVWYCRTFNITFTFDCTIIPILIFISYGTFSNR